MATVDFFWYKHPETGEMISDQRMVGFEEKPLIQNGVKCELVRDYIPPKVKTKDLKTVIIDKNAEVFERDPDYVRRCNPKYVQFQDGHKERYNPNKHY